jgi:hypothetical protein
MTMPPNTARGCVKSADMKFSNDQIFDMANFGESSRWMGWLKNEFSHSLSPEPTAIGAVHQITLGWAGRSSQVTPICKKREPVMAAKYQ